MEKSMILELATNATCYTDKINIFDNEEYTKCSAQVDEMLEEFCKGMTEEEKRTALKNFYAAQGGLEAVTADEYFKEGFKLGLILGAQNFLE